MQHSKTAIFLTGVATSVLTACGGGGEDVAHKPTVQLDVPAATYQAGSIAANVFNALNRERGQCGFGKLAQNKNLDTEASGQAKYAAANNSDSYTQVAGREAFTGVSVLDRFINSGYIKDSGDAEIREVMKNFDTASGNDWSHAAALLSGPYHARVFMQGYREIGIGEANGVVVTSMGFKTTEGNQHEALGDNDVLTWPCAGSTLVYPELRGETPEPVPDRDLSQKPLGAAIQVIGKPGTKLSITEAKLTNRLTGKEVPLRDAIGSDNDKNGRYKAHEAYVQADVPMMPNTTYKASISGMSNGKAFTRSFEFKTTACAVEGACSPAAI